MRWPSHIGIAWGLTAPFCPSPAVIAGATAPDWLEFVIEWLGGRVEHRWETHFLVWWLGGSILAAILYFSIKPLAIFLHTFWFFIGGFLHWVCDALTVSGVPVWWGSRHRVVLLGGKLRTGEPAEFVTAGVVLAISFFFFGWCRFGVGNSCLLVHGKFCEAYNEQVELIDGVKVRLASPKEMRENRFTW